MTNTTAELLLAKERVLSLLHAPLDELEDALDEALGIAHMVGMAGGEISAASKPVVKKERVK